MVTAVGLAMQPKVIHELDVEKEAAERLAGPVRLEVLGCAP
jgi:hypothetical protein